MRKSLSLLLIVVAGLLTFPASMAAWEGRVLISQDGFVSMGNKVLSRPEIQQELANEITKETSGLVGGTGGLLGSIPGANEITGLLGSILGSPSKPTTPAKPNTTSGGALDSLVQPIALDVISSLPNSDIGNEALRDTHASVIAALKSKDLRPEKNSIVLDLGPEVGSVLKQVQVVSSAKPDANAGKIVLIDPTDLAAVFRWARFLRGKTLILSALPLIALAAAAAVAPNRRLVPLYAGISLAVSSGLWILIAKGPLRPWVTNEVAADDAERRVAHAAYDVISASYVNQELVLLIVGVVIAIGGAALVKASKKPPEPDPDATVIMVRR